MTYQMTLAGDNTCFSVSEDQTVLQAAIEQICDNTRRLIYDRLMGQYLIFCQSSILMYLTFKAITKPKL